MFFIVWGKKLVYRTLGYIADFCPMCRTPRVFKLQRVGLARHVYYISFGEGELAGYQRTCQQCGIAVAAKPTLYASVAAQPAALPEMIAQTFPKLPQAYQPTLELEERIRNSPASLTPEERHALIRQPFQLLSPRVEKQFASLHIDNDAGLTLLGVLVTLFIASFILKRVAPDSLEVSMVSILLAGMVLVIWQISQAGRRFMRRKIIPLLAATLQPLNPTDGEVQAVLAEFKKLRQKIGSKMKAKDLMSALNQNGAAALRTAPTYS
jgi:hypothetical protein